MKERILIGIDPDVHKSGYCRYSCGTKKILSHEAYNFWYLIEELEIDFIFDDVVCVYIEAGWLNKKSNWHAPTQHRNITERIAKNIGSNHQVGKLLAEYCVKRNMEYKLIQPKKSKISAKLFKQMTGLEIKNQDIIDACMLVYGL